MACWTVSFSPCAITLPHAALSPSLCAPAIPPSWQVLHTCPYTCSPVRLPFGPDGAAIFTTPNGAMRDRIDASSPVPCARPVTSCVIRMISAIGTTNASTTTMMSCFGVLIGELCWSGSFMASRRAAGDGKRGIIPA